MANHKKPAPTEKTVEMRIDAPVSVHAAWKSAAALSGRPLRGWMYDACQAYVHAPKTLPTKSSAKERTLPLNLVPPAPITGVLPISKGAVVVPAPVPAEPEMSLDELLDSVGMLDPSAPFGGSLP